MKVAIAGAGAVGRSIARELVDNHDVTLLERNPEHIDVDAIPAAHWRQYVRKGWRQIHPDDCLQEQPAGRWAQLAGR